MLGAKPYQLILLLHLPFGICVNSRGFDTVRLGEGKMQTPPGSIESYNEIKAMGTENIANLHS